MVYSNYRLFQKISSNSSNKQFCEKVHRQFQEEQGKEMTKNQTVEAVHEAKKILLSLLIIDKLDVAELHGVKSYLYFNEKIYNIIFNLNLYAKLFSQELTAPAWAIKLASFKR